MNLASSPSDMLSSTLPPRSPHGSWSLIPIPVAVLSLLPPKLANISKEGDVGLLRAYKYGQQRCW